MVKVKECVLMPMKERPDLVRGVVRAGTSSQGSDTET